MRSRILALLCSVWFICGVAFAARAAFLWHEQSVIPHQALSVLPFAQEAGNIAFALSEGKGFSNVFRQETGPTAWLTPVYPLLLAGIFRVFGAFTFPAFLAAALMNCLFSAATSLPIYFAAKKVAGPVAAVLAAWLWAPFPNAVMIPTEWIWDTSLSALLAATLLWATLAIANSQHRRHWCAYGLLWGFSLMNDPAIAAVLPFLLVWLVYRSRANSVRAWRFPALALSVAVLCCLPWTIRNYVQFQCFVPLRSNFPFELWLGNNDIFDPHAVHGIQRITRFEQARLYSQIGETAFMQQKWHLACAFIRSHPLLELRLIGRRIVATWLGTEKPIEDFLSASSLLARVVIICNFLILLGTVSGTVLLFLRRNPFAIPVAAYPLVFPMIYYITHTSLRYRHPADPVLLILTAFAMLELLRANQPAKPRTPNIKSI
ncbi:MAG TPA: glycosyltransferase family 39 protein [Terriglobales bacterium]|nr:glycosyltransferase family 39 protein [Terriglobales bacterium]